MQKEGEDSPPVEAEGDRRFSFVFISCVVFIGSGFNAGVKQDLPVDPDSRSPLALYPAYPASVPHCPRERYCFHSRYTLPGVILTKILSVHDILLLKIFLGK